MNLPELATWLLPSRNIITPVIFGKNITGWIYKESDSQKAWDAWVEQKLGDIQCRTENKEGIEYYISDVSRVGIMLHQNGLVSRVCFDIDNHSGEKTKEQVVAECDDLDKLLGAVGIRFTSRSGNGYHLFYAIPETPIGEWKRWYKSWKFNTRGRPEAFPKSEKQTQAWLPNLPNENGGDAWQLGDMVSALVKALPAFVRHAVPTVVSSTLIEPSAETTPCGSEKMKEMAGLIERSTEGENRNIALNTAAFILGQEFNDGQVSEADARRLIDAAVARGLSESEATATFESGFESGKKTPKTVSNPIAAAKAGHPFHWSDQGNAERLAFYFTGRLRYDSDEGCWRKWTGKTWIADKNGHYGMRAAMKIAEYIRREAAVAPAPASKDATDIRDKLWGWAHTTESRQRLEAMLVLARNLKSFVTDSHDWDKDPFLFNCQNGTIDLRTGELRPHDPADFITKISPVEYDPKATDTRFDGFINWAADYVPERREFIQMSIGHSLTADTSEDSIFILYGPRDSGKTTLIESLRVVMGDYAIPINLELFTRCREANHGPTEHLASLRGVRVATSDEAEPGRELSVGVLKALSGGGSLRVRFLYGHEFNLKITHHLWLSFNDAPKISPDDDAAWKRIKTVGFDHSVPANLRDPSLRPWMELPGGGAKILLSWAVQGCQKWIAATNGGKKHGLTLPASLMSSCTKYRNECDPLADFFKARCVFGPNEKATRAEVVSAYQEWAFEEGIKPQFRCSPRRVAEALKKRDCAEGANSRCERTWKGISVSILNNSEAKKPATSSTSTLHITSHMCKGDIERVRGEVPVVLVEAKTQSNAEPFSFEVGI